MITITAFKWVPPFAQGQVRDHRLRWILNEVGWAYEVDLIDARTQKSEAYLAEQPFGQVPVLRETGRPTLFESGAILLDVATRSGQLLPTDVDQRALVITWLFAALNSLEPILANLAEVDFFIKDSDLKAQRRPGVLKSVQQRLLQLSKALGENDYLVGEQFTIADLIHASVLKLVGHTELLTDYPNLLAFRERCFARPAYQQAIAEQCADFAEHGPQDMHYGD